MNVKVCMWYMINVFQLSFPEYTQEHNEESFVFNVVNPAFAGSMRGIKILQQIIPMSTSSVEVKIIYRRPK